MPLMNLFEPLFLVLVLVTLGSLATAVVRLASGQADRAGRIVRRVGVGAALYFAIAIGVSAVTPVRVYRVGDERCFDDWCLTVARVERADSDASRRYDVTLRLANRARGTPMGEKGTVVYLTDGRGRRYNPETDSTEVPLDVKIAPGDHVDAVRRFVVPTDANDVGLVYAHEGGFPIEWLIISEGGWFKKPDVVRFN